MEALILAGGSGTRFWPLSRRRRPKQLLALEGGISLLQATAERLRPLAGPDSIWVCTTAALADEVRSQLPEVPPAQVLAEPEGRNTAAAIGWSVQSMPAERRRGVVGVFPADHRMADVDGFRRVAAQAERVVAAEDRVMTLGVKPHRVETGYGHLELGETLDAALGLRRVRRFVEKPDLETARRFFASGDYLWNAGIFVFRGESFLERLAACEPELGAGLVTLRERPDRLAEVYRELPSISIDYAVMEKLDDLLTLPLDCGWSDLGSWAALAEVLAGADGGAERGDVVSLDGGGNLLWAEHGTVATVGVEGLIVVATGDAVLVLPKERSQEVKRLVEELRARGRDDLL